MLYKGNVCVIFGILARGRLEPQGIMPPPMCWKKLGNDAGFGGGLLYWGCGKMGFAKKASVVYVGTIWGRIWFLVVFFFLSGKISHPALWGGKKEKKTARPAMQLTTSTRAVVICYACRVLVLTCPWRGLPENRAGIKILAPRYAQIFCPHISPIPVFFG